MSLRTILTMLGGGELDRLKLDTAKALADRFNAHIDALHARGDPRDSIPVLGEGMSGALVEEIMQTAERDAAQRSQAARATFDQWCADSGIAIAGVPGEQSHATTAWREVTGREDELVAVHGRLSDMIVLSHAERAEDISAATTIEAAIFDTGRPVLLAPADPVDSLGTRIAIFWNGSPQAVRAVTAGMPLLQRADEVHVLWVAEGLAPETAQNGLPDYLAWHGVSASVTQLKPDFRATGEALLDESGRLEADLLILGAYTHSRLRQIVLGGVTKYLLGNAKLPVFLAH